MKIGLEIFKVGLGKSSVLVFVCVGGKANYNTYEQYKIGGKNWTINTKMKTTIDTKINKLVDLFKN